jgi:hypothetical protein
VAREKETDVEVETDVGSNARVHVGKSGELSEVNVRGAAASNIEWERDGDDNTGTIQDTKASVEAEVESHIEAEAGASGGGNDDKNSAATTATRTATATATATTTNAAAADTTAHATRRPPPPPPPLPPPPHSRARVARPVGDAASALASDRALRELRFQLVPRRLTEQVLEFRV